MNAYDILALTLTVLIALPFVAEHIESVILD
jgi:hypothetical protein